MSRVRDLGDYIGSDSKYEADDDDNEEGVAVEYDNGQLSDNSKDKKDDHQYFPDFDSLFSNENKENSYDDFDGDQMMMNQSRFIIITIIKDRRSFFR